MMAHVEHKTTGTRPLRLGAVQSDGIAPAVLGLVDRGLLRRLQLAAGTHGCSCCVWGRWPRGGSASRGGGCSLAASPRYWPFGGER